MSISASYSPLSFLFRNPDRSSRISFALLALVLCYVMASLAAGTESPGERMVIIRYLNFVFCGFFAFIIPHVRFPDDKRYLLQALNLDPHQLFEYTAKSLSPVFVLFSVMIGLLAFFDVSDPLGGLNDKIMAFVSGWALMAGIGVMAAVRYITIGEVSQQWQEGRRGAGFMNSMKQVGQTPSVPAGSFPSLLTTVNISAGGMLLVVAGAYLGGVTGSAAFETIPGLLILAYAIFRMMRIRPVFDRFFYHTNAFYTELFLNPKTVQDGREPVRHNAIYWVPSRWKPAAWFSILQLDRKQPVGRMLLVGHILLWTLFYAGLGDALISSFLLLLVLGKCMAIYPLSTRPYAPLLFQYRLLRPAEWILVRFFVNLRWLPLLALSLWLVSLFSARADLSFVMQWALIDIALSLLTALLFTLLHEFRLKKLYA